MPAASPAGSASMTRWPGAVPFAGVTTSQGLPSLVATVAVQGSPSGPSVVILSVCPGGLAPFSTPRKLRIVGIATRAGESAGLPPEAGTGTRPARVVGDRPGHGK